MHLGRNLVFSITACMVFLAYGSENQAFAIDYVLSDAASCLGLPGASESWNAATSTCTKTVNLSITQADTLTVSNGITLAFPSDNNLVNRGTITNNGLINITEGQLINRLSGTFTNFGSIILNGTAINDGVLFNRNSATFSNSGIITIEGLGSTSGRLTNRDAADFTNSGTITIEGTSNTSGRLLNRDTADFTNTGTITIDGSTGNSGQLVNQNSGSITIFGTLTITGDIGNSGQLFNLDSGIITVDCGEITFESLSGNSIDESCQTSFSSTAYEDPTIGKSHDGRQVVEDGICIDEECWTVTAAFHQDFELVEMLSDSTHTITATVFCQHGVHKCNYVAYGVSPYGTNINDSVWKVILQKDHLDNWTMKVIDPDEYLGEVTSTTQIVNDNQHLSASATIEFKKPTPGMILNVEVRDSNGGYRDFKFNDGIAIVDSYAYPSIDASYELPLEIEPLCLNANPDKRYTCAFEKIREQTLINAQIAYEEVMNKKY